MYFWNIEKLKAQLIERPLTEKEVLPYFIATLLMYTLVPYLPDALVFNAWDYLEILIASLAVIIGTLWIYNKNKGNSGSHFLQRYTTLGWVVMIRFIVFFIPIVFAMIFLASYFELFNTEADATSWIDVALITIVELVLYWYFGKHLAEVAEKATYN